MDQLFAGLRILQVAFGIGLVIFVHEAGHYIAARLCRVRVEIFSLGFGPRVWGWKRGATTYQLALVPFGGYVKMAGEEPLAGSDRVPRHDELCAKSPLQRFFIYSGGVIMNAVFALIVLPLVFLAGVPALAPVIADPNPGSPAWRAGLSEGMRFHTVNGAKLHEFQDITLEMALNGAAPVTIEYSRPHSSQIESVTLDPEYNKEIGIYLIGVSPGFDPLLSLKIAENSPAALAGLRNGDRLLGVLNSPQSLSAVEQLSYGLQSEGPLQLRIARAGTELIAQVEPKPEAKSKRILLGLQPGALRVRALRGEGPASQCGLKSGDTLLALGGVPLRGPTEFLQALLKAEAGAALKLEREGKVLDIALPAWSEAEAVAAFKDLALELDMQSARLGVLPTSAAASAGIQHGDRLVRFEGEPVANYAGFLKQSERARRAEKPVQLEVERVTADGTPQLLKFTLTPRVVPALEYGFALEPAEYIWRVPHVTQAIQEGFRASVRFARSVWLTLRKMSSGEVSSKNMGGIISISVASHSVALEGWAKLFFFLCLLSVNLAFLNVLPIPVLDGGHLFFILIEMIKGSPVSERTLGYSQVVGLVLIVSLMVYVTYNDVMRFFP